ncbi:hypothetical protein HPP92_019138 [Vanilla planifolia]|uniref:Uncharacterized protein n=1 Tax=Vanilla planifolia TaxID=51239 RepID=A0A835Q3I0_VANPL|nr:hypothetical protein HPP92_019138 [Vanilla planifolia]
MSLDRSTNGDDYIAKEETEKGKSRSSVSYVNAFSNDSRCNQGMRGSAATAASIGVDLDGGRRMRKRTRPDNSSEDVEERRDAEATSPLRVTRD